MSEATLESPAQSQSSAARALKRFFRTPKGLLVIALAILIPVAALHDGFRVVMPGLVGASLAAMLVDLPILRLREKEWTFPSGALLTGLLVAMVMSPFMPWHVAAVASAIGVASKYVARTRSANVFNPAVLGLLASYFLFGAGHSWWGAVPEMPVYAMGVLFATGLYISDRVNKMPAVLAFLGTHFLLFTVTAFAGDPAHVAELYRAPNLHAALFLAFFMVTDPPTSPPKARDQLIFGVITAAASFATFMLTGGAVYYLLAGVLVANVWEAWRRRRQRAARART